MRVPGGPNSLIFMKCSPINRLAHALWEFAPPQENPGSATVMASSLRYKIDMIGNLFTIHENE